MSEPFMGEVMLVAFNFAPRYWAMCQGQTMAINQNQALFSLLGTTYGGDGVTTYQLPNLGGRVATHRDDGSMPLGAVGGTPGVVLSREQMPAHTHTFTVDDTEGTSVSCTNSFLANMTGAFVTPGGASPDKLTNLLPATVHTTGQQAPHENRQPFLCMNFIIALSGVYPSRN